MMDHDERLSHVPVSLRIRIVYDDKDIIVLHKPANLRSVPGHATPPSSQDRLQYRTITTRKRCRSNSNAIDSSAGTNDQDLATSDINKPLHQVANEKSNDFTSASASSCRLTAQEAWVAAIQSVATPTSPPGDDAVLPSSQLLSPCDTFNNNNNNNNQTDTLLQRLGASDKVLVSIPRKYKQFCQYIHRSKMRLQLTTIPYNHIETLAHDAFCQIETKQRSLLNLPVPTTLDQSAIGQLILLGYNTPANGTEHFKVTKTSDTHFRTFDSSFHRNLFVVHRLDCATSGVMVVARSSNAASFLSKAWRDRVRVKKIYLALVHQWSTKQLTGQIDLPLSPSIERLKWVVDTEHGKPSTTLWKVMSNSDPLWPSVPSNLINTVGTQMLQPILLELQPVTGRTHQLRIHCAAFENSGGIVGDTLYGTMAANRQEEHLKLDEKSCHGQQSAVDSVFGRLYLHAHKLSFPHPSTKKTLEFVVAPDW
jgi:23S rRNA-/tRNA-specific pseudouridylate synthase